MKRKRVDEENPSLERVEHFVDHAIPFLLVLLAIVIIADFTSWGVKYHSIIVIADYVIITFFVADLIFKWRHVRKLIPFLKLYWLDIIAVFPFYLFFRFIIAAREVIAAGETAQKALHEVALLREARLLRETELLKETKFLREARLLRVLPRFLRLFRARLYVVHGHMHLVSEEYARKHKLHRRSST